MGLLGGSRETDAIHRRLVKMLVEKYGITEDVANYLRHLFYKQAKEKFPEPSQKVERAMEMEKLATDKTVKKMLAKIEKEGLPPKPQYNNKKAKKVSAKKVSAKKMSAKKVSARKVSAKKVSAKKVSARKVSARKVSAKKVSAKKVDASKVSGRRRV